MFAPRPHRPLRQCLPNAAARRARGAFTLIELVLVIVSVAVLSAIAVPRYAAALSRYRVDLAAKRVAADLMLARSQARLSSTRQPVDFSAPSNGYTLTGMASPDGGAGGYIVRLDQEPYKAAVGAVSFGDAAATAVWFDRYGMPDQGGTVVVSSGGYEKTIALDAVTGKAVVR